MFFAKIIATCFGIGYLQKGAGTIAALFCCAAWFWTKTHAVAVWEEAVIVALLFAIGVIASNIVEKEWGKDSNKIVIDEAQGMMTALFFVPLNWKYFLIAFVLFRFFDIAKPFYIRRMEGLTGGWGVMMDDLLAGVYSNVILQVIIQAHLFQ